MSAPVPTFAGWYPDADTGGTKYWDGRRWTGDLRLRRKSFAAASSPDDWNSYFLGFSFPALILMGSFSPDESVQEPVLWFLAGMVLLLAYIAYGIYLFRGQGPSTKAVEARLAGELEEVKAKRRAANIAGFAASLLGRRGRSQQPVAPGGDSAAAAQVNAIANPGTARALQNLQSLLYTRAITDEEFEAAKDKLFRMQAPDDSFAQVAKLAELHEAGILGDLEFSSAKARVLGL